MEDVNKGEEACKVITDLNDYLGISAELQNTKEKRDDPWKLDKTKEHPCEQ